MESSVVAIQFPSADMQLFLPNLEFFFTPAQRSKTNERGIGGSEIVYQGYQGIRVYSGSGTGIRVYSGTRVPGFTQVQVQVSGFTQGQGYQG